MQLKKNLRLRKVGSKYMIVDTATEQVDMVDVYTMNETAAWLWQTFAERDFTTDEMVETLCQEYDVTPEQAAADVEALLREWTEFGLLTKSWG